MAGPTPEQTPRQRREAARAEASRVLRGSLHRHDVALDALARGCGAAHNKGGRWTDPNHPEVPGVSDLALMPREIARDLLTWAASHHHLHIVDELAGDAVGDHLEHLHVVIRESADVTTTYSAALADGVISPDERRRLIEELEDSLAAQGALLRSLREAEDAERAVRRLMPRRPA